MSTYTEELMLLIDDIRQLLARIETDDRLRPEFREKASNMLHRLLNECDDDLPSAEDVKGILK